MKGTITMNDFSGLLNLPIFRWFMPAPNARPRVAGEAKKKLRAARKRQRQARRKSR